MPFGIIKTRPDHRANIFRTPAVIRSDADSLADPSRIYQTDLTMLCIVPEEEILTDKIMSIDLTLYDVGSKDLIIRPETSVEIPRKILNDTLDKRARAGLRTILYTTSDELSGFLNLSRPEYQFMSAFVVYEMSSSLYMIARSKHYAVGDAVNFSDLIDRL